MCRHDTFRSPSRIAAIVTRRTRRTGSFRRGLEAIGLTSNHLGRAIQTSGCKYLQLTRNGNVLTEDFSLTIARRSFHAFAAQVARLTESRGLYSQMRLST